MVGDWNEALLSLKSIGRRESKESQGNRDQARRSKERGAEWTGIRIYRMTTHLFSPVGQDLGLSEQDRAGQDRDRIATGLTDVDVELIMSKLREKEVTVKVNGSDIRQGTFF